jgi:uncharacterized protein (DUF1684 family)
MKPQKTAARLVAAGWAIMLAAVLVSCRSGAGPETGPAASRQEAGDPDVVALLQERAEKDRSYREDPASPIRDEDRPGFGGLAYYPVDAAFRFRVKLHRYPRPERLLLATNTGEKRDALRYGYFEFAVGGTSCRLQVYRTEDSVSGGKPYLFIPFLDATSGKETYGGGRYLDLEENTSGIYDLDFNRAYNPLCAYGRKYSCPLPPEENRLPVAILAGEKTYRPAAAPK